jgi:hypothetical protein
MIVKYDLACPSRGNHCNGCGSISVPLIPNLKVGVNERLRVLHTGSQGWCDYPHKILLITSFGSTVIDLKLDILTSPAAAPFGFARNFRCV